MEYVDTVTGEVLGAADPGVAHNGDPAARLISGTRAASSAAAPVRAVERMEGSKLVPHFVGDIINVESIARRVREPGDAAGLQGGARAVQRGDAAAACTEDVPDIVVGRSDHGVELCLVLAHHRAAAAIGVRVVC